METGDDELLRWLCKPATSERVVRYVQSVKDAGLSVGLIVLLGPGGRQFSESHVRKSARVLNEMPLGRGDYVYLSPLVISAGSRYAEQAAALGAEPLTREEMDQQEQAIRAALDFDERRGRPYIARYEMETFVY
jgi:radical SAM superfamily enzyme YgiQ (UPF0313 family)